MQDPYAEKHVTQMETLVSVSVSFLCPGLLNWQKHSLSSWYLLAKPQIKNKRKR